jgi:hypothetical protein
MKPPILHIGRVYEDADGITHVEDWHLGTRPGDEDLPYWKPGDSAEDLLAFLMGLRDAAPSEDKWTVEELREIAEQEAVLTLLPTTEDSL